MTAPRGKGELRLIDHAAGEECRPEQETHHPLQRAGPGRSAGPDRADGAPGPAAADGVSVTSAPEPAGANCANGGSAFTSASGVTYACNGATGNDGAAAAAAEAIIKLRDSCSVWQLDPPTLSLVRRGHCLA
jgi:hypothetical protein